MEQESRAGCILHGCGVLAALAGLCAASGAACFFRSHTGMAGMGAAGVFPAGAGRRSLRPAAVRSGQRAADTL